MRAMLTGNPIVDLEPNDTFAEATDIGTGDQAGTALMISESGDEDVYRWVAPESGVLNVDVLFRDVIGDLDLHLYTSNTARVAISDSVSDNEHITYNVDAGETYFVKVFGFGDETNTYDLLVDGPEPTVSVPADRFEANDSSTSATDLGTNDQSQASLTVHTFSDEDWFKWTASSDGNLTVDVLFANADGNIDAQLLDANGNLLESSTSTTDNEQLSYAVDAGQAYFVRVFTPGFQTQNAYSLNVNGPEPTFEGVQIVDDGDPGFATAGEWSVSNTIGFESDIHISSPATAEDVATWTFSVTPGKYRVAATWFAHPGRETDVQYTILDGTNEIAVVNIDQVQAPDDFTDQGAIWESLGGLHEITSNSLTVRLSDGSDVFLIADAMRIERVDDASLAPEIEVSDGPTVVLDGGTVNFGSTTLNASADKVLTVRNLGTVNLTLTPLNASQLPTGYQLLSNFGSTNLAPGASTTFTIRLSSGASGAYGGPISFGNNDADESPFNLSLLGTVADARIVDDGDAAFTTVGQWTVIGGGFQGDSQSSLPGNGSDVARWTFNVSPGKYRIAATWSPNQDRATDAPYTILDGSTVLDSVEVNQQQAPNDLSDQGASWEYLDGVYDIASSSLVVELSDDAGAQVIADAVRVERVGQLTPEVEVLDGATAVADGGTVDFGIMPPQGKVDKIFTVRNAGAENLTLSPLSPSAFPNGFTLLSNISSTLLAPGQSTEFSVRFQSNTVGSYGGPVSFVNNDADENPFNLVLSGDVKAVTSQFMDNGDTGFSTTGTWPASTSGGYQGNSLFNLAGSGTDIAVWKFDVTPGRYRVSATWAHDTNRASDAPYTILDGSTVLSTVDVNQKVAPNDLADQGGNWEDLGGPYNIIGTSLVVRLSDNADGIVGADAIRIERVSESSPEIEVLNGTTVVTDGGSVDFGTSSPQVPVDKVFTVRNAGAQNLTLSPLSPSAFPAGFTLVSNISSTVLGPGQTTNFTVRFQSAATGNYGGTVSFGNNDADENPFDLALSGKVTVVSSRIMDNGDTGFSTTGTWPASTSGGYQGNSLFNLAGSGTDIAVWKFDVTPGQYRVSATWAHDTNRASDAPYTILDGSTVLSTVDVNQKVAPNDLADQGGNWEDLGGPYNMTGSTLVVRLSDNADGIVSADAIRIERVSESSPEIEVLNGTTVVADGGSVDFGTSSPQVPVDKVFTVRNAGAQNLTLSPLSPSAFPAGFTLVSNISSTVLGPGQTTNFTVRFQSAATGNYGGTVSFGNNDADENPFDLALSGKVTVVSSRIMDNGDTGFSTTGTWPASTSGGYQGDSLYNTAGSGTEVAVWKFDVTPGQYRVSATWAHDTNRASDAPYTILDGSTVLSTVDVNQKVAPNDLADQGGNWEDLGGPYNMTGSTLVVRLSDGANGIVSADAIRIERVSESSPEIEVLNGTTVVADGGSVDFGTSSPQVPVDKVFTVRNAGAQNLTLSPLSPSAFPAGFTLLSNISSTVLGPGQTTKFTVRFQSAAIGDYGGTISFNNNDADENPFDLALSGKVTVVSSRIMDNGDTGFSTTGEWPVSTSGGYQGDSLYNTAGSGTDVAVWKFDVTPGRYRVSATWAHDTNRASDAPYTILDGSTVLSTVDVNQKVAPNDLADQGGNWEDLGGPYNMTGSTLVVRLSDNANGIVSADAIRIERVSESSPEIEVLDGTTLVADGGSVDFGTTLSQVPVDKVFTVRNAGVQNLTLSPLSPSTFPDGFTLVSNISSTVLGPGQATNFTVRFQAATVGSYGGTISFGNNDADENPFDLALSGKVAGVSSRIMDNGDAGFITTGEWPVSTSGGYQGDSLYNTAGSGTDVAVWTFDVTPGLYRVSATWAHDTNRAADAPYTVLDGATVLSTVDVNQKVAPNDLADQGGNWEDLGGPHNIVGSTLVVRLSDNANGFVSADAIRIERVGELSPEIEVLDGTTVVTDGGSVDFGTTSPQVAVDKVFTVRNVGGENLNLSPLSSGDFPNGFTLLSNITSTNLAPGQSTQFTVRFQTVGVGSFGGSISLDNNDTDENPFDLVLGGNVASSQTMDDGDSRFSTVGTWSASSSGFHGDSLINTTGIGNDVARWKFDVAPGRYRVAATWTPGQSRATDAPFTILDGTTVLDTIDINQQQSPNDFTDQGSSWEHLDGSFDILGNSLVVELSDNANGQYVIADAVRIELVGDTSGGSDGFEPNNSFDTATPLGAGDQVHNNLAISPDGDVDYFRWTAPASGTLTVDTFFVDDDGDLELSLYGSNRNLLQKADSVSDNERVTQNVIGGETYYIHVFPAGGATNQYDLAINGPDGSGINALTVDIIEASISENGGSTLATVSRAGTSGNLTVNLVSSDIGEATVPSQVIIPSGSTSATFTITAVDDTSIDGTQNVSVTASASNFANGSDTILVTDDDVVLPGDDHGNNSSTSTFVAVPSTTAGEIEVGGDSDWFGFSAAQGKQYTFETTLQGLDDSTLTLYDTDGVTELQFDDDSAGNRASLIQWGAPTSGTYYLKVEGYNAGYTGNYSLSVRLDDLGPTGPAEPNDSFSEASNLASGDQLHQELSIDGGSDQDYYRWVAPQSGQLRVDILFVDAAGDLEMNFYGSNQIRLAKSDTVSDNESITYNVVGGEVYYIHVFGFGQASNIYDLFIDGP